MSHFLESDDKDHWKSAVGIGAAGCFLAGASVAARMYTRYFVTRSVGVDDIMAVVSLVSHPSCNNTSNLPWTTELINAV